MSRYYSASDFVQLSNQHKAELQKQLQQNQEAQSLNAQHAQELVGREQAAQKELLEVLLPELSQGALQRAAALCNYPVLVQRDLIGEMGRTAAQVRARIGELEADPRYQDRQLLRAPRVGTLTRAIDELMEFRAPLQDVVQRCAHPRLDRLMQSGYGTAKYDTPFWRLSYYSDWRAADEILEKFPNKSSFAEVREEFTSACSTLSVYDKKLKDLRDEVAAGEAVEREIATRQAELLDLPAQTLEHARQLLGTYLRDSDPADVKGLEQAPQVEGMYKRYIGLKKQGEYLRQAGQHYLESDQLLLRTNIDKLDKQIVKYSQPRKMGQMIPGEVVERQEQSVRSRVDKSQKHLQGYSQTHYAVYTFDQYDRASLARDILWWDLMSAGRLHGDYLSDVSEYRQRNPWYTPGATGYGVDADDLVEAQAAAQAARAGRARGRSEEARRDVS